MGKFGAAGLPIKNLAQMRQRAIRHHRPAVILDLVEKPDDVGSLNVIDLPCAELRINQPGNGALPV